MSTIARVPNPRCVTVISPATKSVIKCTVMVTIKRIASWKCKELQICEYLQHFASIIKIETVFNCLLNSRNLISMIDLDMIPYEVNCNN